MKIYYWSPFTSNVATIKAVINSAYSLKKLFKIDTYLINSFGEWKKNRKEIYTKKIKIIENPKKINNLFINGFFQSRVAFIKIFFNSLFFLKKILIKNKPDFLIIHLITSLPLILFIIFKFDTKLILRISGTPRLNFFRKWLWKFSRKNIFFITVPTKETLLKIKKLNIFDPSKIFFLPDPVFLKNKISLKSKKKNNQIPFILNIGRLTKQKNQQILIKSFQKISKKYNNINLLILGEGEKFKELSNLSKELNLEKKIKFLGHVDNPYKYIKSSLCVVITSLWEDPGFVMIEASALKKTVICSNCPSGPKEFFNKGKNGFLFKNNNIQSLIQNFDKFMTSDPKKLKKKILKNYNKSLEYSDTSHAKNLYKLLKFNEKR